MEYVDFELSVKRVGTHYTVEVRTPEGMISEDAEDIQPLEIPEDHMLTEEGLTQYGRDLFNHFIRKNVRTLFDNSYSKAEKENKNLRFLLEPDEKSQKIFWELLYYKTFLCLDPRVSFVRILPLKDIPVKQVSPPLKVLLVASSPFGQDELRLSYERDAIKENLQDMADSQELYLHYTDISSAENIVDHLSEGFHIFHYCGHGNMENGMPILALEDENGFTKPTKVTDLAPSITGSRDLCVVIFDACKLAYASERVLQFGIPAFIGMQDSIYDDTATTFFEEFYRVLVTEAGAVDVAVQKARSRVVAVHGIGNVDWAIPVLVLTSKNTQVFNISGEAVQRREMSDFSGLVAVSKFVGRRAKIREIQDRIRDEDIRIVVVHGYGGVGKSSLVGKVVRELPGYIVYAVATPHTFTFGEFFDGFCKFLMGHGIADLSGYKEKSIPEKVDAVVSLLGERRILVVFDGFEEQVEKEAVKEEGLRLFLERVVREKVKGKVVITSKVTFEVLGGRFSGSIGEIQLDGFFFEESSRYLGTFGLQNLGESERKFLHEKTEGHPYALEIFVGLMKRFPLEELLKDESLYVGEIDEKFVGKLLSSLNVRERENLERCAVFDFPVPLEVFEYVGADRRVISDLVGLNVVKFDRGLGLYKVHFTTRDVVLSGMGKEDLKELHGKAAQFWEERAKETRVIWDIVRAQDHYFEAGDYGKAGEIVNEIVEALHMWGCVALSKTFLKRLEDKTEGLVKAGILHHLGITNRLLGDYEKAVSYYEGSLKIEEELGDKRGIAYTLHGIGMIHHDKGDYERALSYYGRSLKIKEELGDKWGIAQTLHQIGNVHYAKGDYEGALSCYERSLKIEEELGDKRGIAYTLHQIGMVHHDRRDYEKAVSYYEKSLKIEEELGHKRGIASTLHQIGMVHHDRRDYEKAVSYYEKSLKMKEELGDKRGIAKTLGQMSRIHLENKDFRQSLKLDLIALSICDYLQSPDKRIAIADIQKIKETIGEQEFNKLVQEVTPEVENYLKSILG